MGGEKYQDEYQDEVSRMRRFSGMFLALLLPLSIALGQTALGQTAPPPQLQPRTAQSAKAPAPGAPGRQISFEVQVTDKSGAPVRGLQKEDFTVLDDKQPQNIVSFRAVESSHAADAGTVSTTDPVQIILVIDAVNVSPQALARERDEVKKFLLRNGGKLEQPVSLVILSDAGTDIQNASSRDGNELATLLDQKEIALRTITPSQGYWGATERFDLSLKALSSLGEYARTRPGRKLMIWVSPGWPSLSGPNTQLSGKNQQQFFSAIVAVSTGFREARVTVYGIDPLGLSDFTWSKYYEQFLKGVKSSSQALPADLGLQVIAAQTGGLAIASSNDLAAAIANCTKDGDAFYVVSFEAARADHANEYHAIVVTVDKPGTKARARTGYYSQR